ncbi:helix-turn-helix domain-containing protein [Actinomadura sp. WAC 06369]|uniref:helix-turn-helix domain-containing protein n=1 Tax=Actinomadura sp. WAC 06369 TaxID=2203193 RepID=UPI000F7BA82B|nr:helix-turn-helix transcriptional regulator [Actinomadura sp. WAC 06369]RSN56600.1 transcriptional regulator [Actinomadura sp. WAC 06369]
MARGEHAPSCARRWRERAEADGWRTWRLVQAIHGCCGVSLLKAHRLARGWTAQTAIDHLMELCERENLGRPQANIDLLNVWENGRARPRPDTIDRLARLYRANPVRLGLDADYSEDDGTDEVVIVPARSPRSDVPEVPILHPSALHVPGPSTETNDDVRRRTLFNDVLTGGQETTASRLLTEVDQLRQQMDRTLATGTVTDDQMDRLEEMVLHCRREYLATPPIPMLCRLMLEFADIRALASQRQPGPIQCRLSRVAAALAILSADALMKLGDIRQARAWYGTAKTAADDTGDPQLRALVRAQEAMLPYYYGDLTETVHLAREAQALGRATPSSPTALAAAAEARALARLGDHRSSMSALGRAQQLFSQIKGSNTGALAFDFTEQRLYLYMSGTFAHLPNFHKADAVHQSALALCRPRTPSIDPSLVKLDQATSLAHNARPAEACELATQTLLALPPEQRTTIVFVRGRDVHSAIPTEYRRSKAMRALEEVLSLETSPLTGPPPRGRRDA